MRLKLRFSSFSIFTIKAIKSELIKEGLPPTLTNGYILDTAIESISTIEINCLDWKKIAMSENLVYKKMLESSLELSKEKMNITPNINSSITIRQSSSDYIDVLTEYLAHNVFEGRVYKNYAVKLIFILSSLIKYDLLNKNYYINQ